MDGTEDTGRRESRNAGEIPSGETKSVVHPCGHLAAWMREALPVGFCNGFVKGTHGSARGHFVCSFLEMCGCLAELFCSSQSCPLLLQSLLVHLSLLASFWLLISCKEMIVLSMNLSGWQKMWQKNQTV